MSRAHLERVLARASASDWCIAAQAYWRYHVICKGIATRTGYPLETSVAVFAALSPNNDYIGNIRDAARMLQAARDQRPIDSFKVSTYGANKRKAWGIIHGTPPMEAIKAPKTRSFYRNVCDPNDPIPVTVDGHVFNAYENRVRPLSSGSMKTVTRKYEVVADTIREIGHDRQQIPNVIQAAIWYCWKRLRQSKHTTQTEFWGPDFAAAGLGWQLETSSVEQLQKWVLEYPWEKTNEI